MCRYIFLFTSCLHSLEVPLECLSACSLPRIWRIAVDYFCPQCVEHYQVYDRSVCIEEMTTFTEVSS